MSYIEAAVGRAGDNFLAVFAACVGSNFFGPAGGLLIGVALGLTTIAVREAAER